MGGTLCLSFRDSSRHFIRGTGAFAGREAGEFGIGRPVLFFLIGSPHTRSQCVNPQPAPRKSTDCSAPKPHNGPDAAIRVKAQNHFDRTSKRIDAILSEPKSGSLKVDHGLEMIGVRK
jgi:hypothetical protein